MHDIVYLDRANPPYLRQAQQLLMIFANPTIQLYEYLGSVYRDL